MLLLPLLRTGNYAGLVSTLGRSLKTVQLIKMGAADVRAAVVIGVDADICARHGAPCEVTKLRARVHRDYLAGLQPLLQASRGGTL